MVRTFHGGVPPKVSRKFGRATVSYFKRPTTTVGPSSSSSSLLKPGSKVTSFQRSWRRSKYGDSAGTAVYRRHLHTQNVLATIKSRQLQLASGGRYQFFVLSKILNFLKQEFLVEKERRVTLEQLLTLIKEPDVSDEIKEWLTEVGLPSHRKIRVVEFPQSEPRYAYQPPIEKLKVDDDLLRLLRTKWSDGEGGVMRSVVEDSMPLAYTYIKDLLARDKITEITRVDRTQVLFYKPPVPPPDRLTVDPKFAELWRKVDVSNKTMHQVKQYLKIKRIPVIDDEAFDKQDLKGLFGEEEDNEEETVRAAGSSSSKATATTSSKSSVLLKRRKKGTGKKPGPEVKKRRKMKIRDNLHVLEDLKHLGEDGEEEEEDKTEGDPPTTSSALKRKKATIIVTPSKRKPRGRPPKGKVPDPVHVPPKEETKGSSGDGGENEDEEETIPDPPTPSSTAVQAPTSESSPPKIIEEAVKKTRGRPSKRKVQEQEGGLREGEEDKDKTEPDKPSTSAVRRSKRCRNTSN